MTTRHIAALCGQGSMVRDEREISFSKDYKVEEKDEIGEG
jgi:hypothetical protein